MTPRGSAARGLLHEQHEPIVGDLEQIKSRDIDQVGRLKIAGKDKST
jgi:hypothetical protein